MAEIKLNVVVASTGTGTFDVVVGGLERVDNSLEKSKGTAKGWDSLIQGVAQGVGQRIFALAAQVPGMLAGAVSSFTSAASSIADASEQLSFSPEALQSWEYAGSFVGVTADQIGGAVSIMSKNIGDGGKETEAALKSLGLSLQGVQQAGPEAAFRSIVDGLKAMPDPFARADAAAKLFGKSGVELVKLFKSDYPAAIKEFQDSNLGMTASQIAAADEIDDGMTRVTAAWTAFRNEALVAALPVMKSAIEFMTDTAREARAVAEGFRALPAPAKLVAEALAGLTFALVAFRIAGNSVAAEMLPKLWAALTVNVTWAGVTGFFTALPGLIAGGAGAVTTFIAAWAPAAGLVGLVGTISYAIGSMLDIAIQKSPAASKALQTLWDGIYDAWTGTDRAVLLARAKVGPLSGPVPQHLVPPKPPPAPKATAEQEAAAKAAAKAYEQLKASLLGTDTQRQMDQLARAARDLGEQGKLSAEVLMRVAEQAERLQAAGGKVPTALAALLKAWREEMLHSLFGTMLDPRAPDRLPTVPRSFGAFSGDQLAEQARAQQQALAGVEAEAVAVSAAIREAEARAAELQAKVDDTMTGFMDLAHGLADVFGGDVAAAVGAAEQYWGAVDQAAADGILTWGEMVSLAAQTVQAFKKATDSASAFSRALGGAMVGAKLGATVGGIFGPLGSAIGAAAGGIIGGIAGIFRKPSWVKVGEEAGKVLGVAIGKEMAKQIEQTAKDLHISVKDAALLSINDVAEQSGKAMATFLPQLSSLMDAVSRGSVPAAKGVEELGKAFTTLEQEAEGGSRAAADAMVRLISQSEAQHVRVKEIVEFVKKAFEQGGAGLGAMFDYLGSTTDASAERLQTYGLLGVAMFHKLRAQGLSYAEVFDVIGPAIDKAIAAYEKLGLELPPALAEVARLRGLMADNAGLIAGIDGARAALEALGSTGALTADLFNRITVDVPKQFDDLIAAGFTTDEALAILAPTLKLIADEADRLHLSVDAGTQALIDQANTKGLLEGLKSPQDQMVESQQQMVVLLGLLVQKMGVELPAAIRDSIAAWNDLNHVANQTHGPAGPNGPPDYHGGGQGEASGFYAMSMPMGPLPGGATPLLVHPGEEVSVTPRATNVIPFPQRGPVSVSVGDVHVHLSGAGQADPRQLGVEIAEAIRRGLVPQIVTEVGVKLGVR